MGQAATKARARRKLPTITHFKNALDGQDAYILGAGGSLNYLDPGFFDGRVVVGVNSAARTFGVTPSYVVVKEHTEEAIPNSEAHPGVPIICSRNPYGGPDGEATPPDLPHLYVYDHLVNQAEGFEITRDWPTEPDQLVVSLSTITSAMHFAAYAGARNIILVAHDCGRVGEDQYVDGYPQPNGQQPEFLASWLVSIEPQTIAVKRELERRYGVRVYSLSPFINMNLEGLPYVGSNRLNTW